MIAALNRPDCAGPYGLHGVLALKPEEAGLPSAQVAGRCPKLCLDARVSVMRDHSVLRLTAVWDGLAVVDAR